MGMIGGQMTDMLYENKNIDIARLIKMYALKTGCMITVSAKTGCIAGGASEEEINLAINYANNIGLAFQITDDILDNIGDAAIIGKNIKSDEKNSKNTFTHLLGVEKAREYAEQLTAEAVFSLEGLKKINKNAEIKNLENCAGYLLGRKN